MFRGKVKQDVADELAKRNAYLFHACQLQDFHTYLTIGGISARGLMESKSLQFTKFESDENDKKHGTWNLVFGNFNDFGSSYHRGGKSVPNPYGPILIKIDPKAVLDAQDFSVTLRSAGAKDFNRDAESLESLEEFQKIFTNTTGNFIKYKKELQTSFPKSNVGSSPEWSMSTGNGLISIEHFVSIVVDPIDHNSLNLFDEVKRLSVNYDEILGGMVRRKNVNSDFQNLVTAISSGATNISTLKSAKLSKEWLEAITPIEWQLKRYANYTKKGTIDHMSRLKPPTKAS